MRRRGSCSSIVDGWSRRRRRKSSSPIRRRSARANSSSAMQDTAPTAAVEYHEGGGPMGPSFHLLTDAPKPVAPSSHAVEAGPFVVLTGQLPTDPNDDALPIPARIEAQ